MGGSLSRGGLRGSVAGLALALLLASGAAAASGPTISALFPDTGPTAGATQLTVVGNELEGARAVYFGGTPGKVLEEECDGLCEISPYTSMSVESPPHAPGTVDVTVENRRGQLSPVSVGDTFTFTGPAIPVIEAVQAQKVTKRGAQLEAKINPDGSQTTYAFWVSYDPCQHGAGECALEPQTEELGRDRLHSGSVGVAVHKQLSKLKHGCVYAVWVLAANTSGEAESKPVSLETDGSEGLSCLR
jgi:hypothetical protein